MSHADSPKPSMFLRGFLDRRRRAADGPVDRRARDHIPADFSDRRSATRAGRRQEDMPRTERENNETARESGGSVIRINRDYQPALREPRPARQRWAISLGIITTAIWRLVNLIRRSPPPATDLHQRLSKLEERIGFAEKLAEKKRHHGGR